MRGKIAVVRVSQETCSFNPVNTTLDDFEISELNCEADFHRDGLIDGFVSEARRKNYVPEGVLMAKAMAGGKLSASTFERLREFVRAGLKKVDNPDIVFIGLHGAMEAENEFDTEGVILSDVREIVGKNCFIAVSLDHHAGVTEKMVGAADVMVGYETQPHRQREAGIKTALVMDGVLAGRKTPHASLVKVPMLAPQDNFLTSGGPMKEWFDLAREIEKEPGIIVASTFPTQPWLDIPANAWSCLVYAQDPLMARSRAEMLAQKAWDLRERFWHSERLPVSDAVVAANNESCGVVVMSDTGDAVYGGGPGDNMSIAAEMMKQPLCGPALVPVVDPEAFVSALRSGTGSRITLKLGGKMSRGFSPCIRVDGTVRAISDADTLTIEDGRQVRTGRNLLLECGNLKIAIMEKRSRIINFPILYENLGIDTGSALMAVLKTGSNFQHFSKYTSRIIRVDSPGVTQSDLTAFRWKNMKRPMYPFDDVKDWRLK